MLDPIAKPSFEPAAVAALRCTASERGPARALQSAANAPILAAVDFSPFSEKALVWAARTARSFDAPLLALHVVHDSPSTPNIYRRTKKHRKHLRRIEEAAADMMSDFLERMAEKHPRLLGEVEHRLVVGLPVTRILEAASSLGAQMIVMGSHGRNGLSRLVLGSSSERVAQLSPIPVTIVKSAG